MPKIIDAPFQGLKVIELDIFKDERGFFVERYNRHTFKNLGHNNEYVQDNSSRSFPGVIRGLHYQKNPDQAKLVGCTNGKIFDVVVDIRKSSKTFGKHFTIELSATNGKLLFVPAGFAHGFCVLGDEIADVTYKVDGHYNKEGEGGIAFNDKDINIDWPVKNPIVSNKDEILESFKDYSLNPRF